MNHKRKRPKHQRAGCLLCKPWKSKRGPKYDVRNGDRGALKYTISEQRRLQKDRNAGTEGE